MTFLRHWGDWFLCSTGALQLRRAPFENQSIEYLGKHFKLLFY